MLKFQLDQIDDLDDSLKPLYEEKDGKFVLKVDGVPQQKDDDTELQQELERFRQKHAEAEKHRKEQEKAARQAAIEAAQKAGDLEALQKSLDAEKDAIRAEYEPKLKHLESVISKKTIDQTAMEVANEIFGEHAKAMLLNIKARLSYEIDGDDVVVRVLDDQGKLSAKSVDDLKKEFLDSPMFAPFVVGTKATGAGKHAPPGAIGTKNVREMSPQEKHEFIQKHGQKRYLELSRQQRKK